MAQTVHSKIIKTAAREVLIPLGLEQKGRSRLWFDDHGWWLILVEFQPSGFSKGTYLNVGVNWLWYKKDYFSFDYGSRVGSFIEFRSDQQFNKAVYPVAELAAKEVLKYRELFSTVEATAKILLSEEQITGWEIFNSAVIAGICGYKDEARELFSKIILESGDNIEPDWVRERRHSAEELDSLVNDTEGFRKRITSIIMTARQLRHLKEWNKPLFYESEFGE